MTVAALTSTTTK